MYWTWYKVVSRCVWTRTEVLMRVPRASAAACMYELHVSGALWLSPLLSSQEVSSKKCVGTTICNAQLSRPSREGLPPFDTALARDACCPVFKEELPYYRLPYNRIPYYRIIVYLISLYQLPGSVITVQVTQTLQLHRQQGGT